MFERFLKSALVALATMLSPLLFGPAVLADELPNRTIESSAAGAYTDSSDRTQRSVTSAPILIQIERDNSDSAGSERHSEDLSDREELSDSEDMTTEAYTQLMKTAEVSAGCSIHDYDITDAQLNPMDLKNDQCRQNSPYR